MKDRREIALRYPGTCAECGDQLDRGTRAFWSDSAREVTCLSHEPSVDQNVDAGVAFAKSDVFDTGIAGQSAQKRYDKLSRSREKKVREAHPRVGGLLLAIFDNPQTTRAWAQGARGERLVGERLDGLHATGVLTVHDRRVPRSRTNIDHIAIGPSGIFVIDAKHRDGGRIELRRTGSIFNPGPSKLVVGGRNCNSLIDGMSKQVAAVRSALGDCVQDCSVPIIPMLAFVGIDWSPFASPFFLRDVWVGIAKDMAKFVGRPGNLGDEDRQRLADAIARKLKPA